MNSSTGSHANTRIKQKVIMILSFFEANFALGFFLTVFSWLFFKWIVFHNIPARIDSSFVFTSGSVDFTINAGFADEELDTAQFDNLSRFEFVAQVFAIFLFEFADNEIGLLFSFDITGVGLIGIESLVLIVFLFGRTGGLCWEVEFDFLVSYWIGWEAGQQLKLLSLVFFTLRLLHSHHLKT